MAKVRKILRRPEKSVKNYFVVDASFLANKYLGVATATSLGAEQAIREDLNWWAEIDRQIKDQRARVYLPDLCIAEAFKVLAKKCYQEKTLSNSAYKKARDKLSKDVSIEHKTLQSQKRYIGYHDVASSRDIIISIGRFYELFMKHKFNVGVIDLILVSTAKYLIDFHDARREQLHIVTHDDALWRGTKKISELPNAYNPAEPADAFIRIFK